MVVNSRICDCIRDDITKFTGGMLLVDLQIRSLIVRGATKSCHYRGTNPVAGTLLVSLTWFKPGERLSLANRWMCQYPYGKDTGAGRGTNRGESNVSQLDDGPQRQ